MVKFEKINAYTQIRKKIQSNKLSIGVVGLDMLVFRLAYHSLLKKLKYLELIMIKKFQN